MIVRETVDEQVTVLRLEHGKVNALDIELLEAVREEVDTLRKEEHPPAIVVTGAGSSFSGGVDLFRVLDGGAEYVRRFLPLLSTTLRRLINYPRPLVAAVNGHAVAGGLVMACACDHRLMVEQGAKVGVPELKVGVPFPWVALEAVRAVAGDRFARELVFGGALYSPEDALRGGLVDRLCPAGRLLGEAVETARSMAASAPEGFRLAKLQLWETVLEREDREEKAFDREVQAAWEAPATHRAIREYMERTVGNAG